MTGALFTLTFAVAAPFWALTILLPRWSWTARIIGSAVRTPFAVPAPGAPARRPVLPAEPVEHLG
jgi:ABA4-like protein